MKVKKIAKQLDEYKRLDRLIRGLDRALKCFNEVEEPSFEGSPMVNNLVLIGHVTEDNKKLVTVNLNSDITELVRDEVKEILLQHRVALKKQQDKLEVA